MSSNKDLDEILKASYKQIKQWHKENVNPDLTKRIDSRGFGKKYLKAKDVYYYGDDGKEYIDFLGGYGLNCVGHNHPRIKKVITDFLSSDLPIYMQAGLLAGPGALAKKLYEFSGLENCFFVNSGTEVVEAAIKFARKSTGKSKIISCEAAFHGKSYGSLSIGGRQRYKEPFEPLIPGCIQVPYSDAKAIEMELQKGDVAMVAIEPIQGEGGIIVPYEGYLNDVSQLCKKYQALLFLDEIQTGLGRTGKMFAYQYEDVKPDMLGIAKGLSGTIMPIGALVGRKDIFKKVFGTKGASTIHSSTFGGNNLSTIVGLTTLKIIEEEKLAQNAKEQGDYLLNGLNKLKEKYPRIIRNVRGKGLMVGIEIKDDGSFISKIGGKILKSALDENLCTTIATILLNNYQIITIYTLNKSDVLRLEPALTIKREHIDKFLEAFEKICKSGYFGAQVKAGKILAEALVKK